MSKSDWSALDRYVAKLSKAPTRFVSVGAEYAVHHEFGAPAHNLPARPFLGPALESVRAEGILGDLLRQMGVKQAEKAVEMTALAVMAQTQVNIARMPVGTHTGLIDTGFMLNSLQVSKGRPK